MGTMVCSVSLIGLILLLFFSHITANCQLPTANCQLPTANCQLPTANCQLPTANCQLPTAHCQLPTAHCPLPTANCQLPTLFLNSLVVVVSVVAMLFNKLIPLSALKVFAHHLSHQLLEADFWSPSEFSPRFACITKQCVDF